MRYAINFALAASLVAAASAHQQHHGHQHFHARKEASPVEQRDEPDTVTKYVPGAVETVYEMNGKIVKGEEAKQGLDKGDFVVVGETEPTVSPPPPPPKPTTTSSASSSSSSEAALGAQFIEKSSTTTSEAAPTTSAAAPSKSPSPPANNGGSNSGGQGLDTPFPSGKVKCSEFPEDYGALPLDWLGYGKWSGLQFVPDYTEGALSISNIITGIVGDDCSEGCMCSYACPPGYQKTQWSKAQGSTKESIGGLYCNKDGYLELTRPQYKTLCMKGAGGVSVKNDLDELVSTCRTDYPGTESMVIPAVAQPGGTVELCNPEQDNYYVWDGNPTTAQYYVNNKGLDVEDACTWNSPKNPKSAGNWAPMNIGVGKSSDGITYLSIFPNEPTSSAKLNFNIEVQGDITSKCSYIDGVWTGGSNGCTTGVNPGGKAVFRYF